MGARKLGLLLVISPAIALLAFPLFVAIRVATDIVGGILIGCALLLWGESARPIAIRYGERIRDRHRRQLKRSEELLRKYYYPQPSDLEELFAGK